MIDPDPDLDLNKPHMDTKNTASKTNIFENLSAIFFISRRDTVPVPVLPVPSIYLSCFTLNSTKKESNMEGDSEYTEIKCHRYPTISNLLKKSF